MFVMMMCVVLILEMNEKAFWMISRFAPDDTSHTQMNTSPTST